ncbi:MAG: hypothetical protein IJX59_08330 [Clostridia bacterium]|nr:hypothetical protein [Clostridia bacterium]
MKKLIHILALLLAMLSLFAPLSSFFAPSFAEPSVSGDPLESPSPSVEQEERDPNGAPATDPFSAVLLYHNESGTVLYEKGGDRMAIPAGPAPRMVAALIFAEHYDDLSRKVTVNRLIAGLAASTLNPGLKSGEQIAVYDLLCAMLIANSDDAIFALAFDLFENDESAPALMLDAINKKAQALGMKDTVFYNLTGADPKREDQSSSYTTLADLLTLALAFEKVQVLSDICAIDDLTLDPTNKSGKRRILTRNYLLSAKRIGGYTYKYATGLATVSGASSGHHAIITAKIGSKTFNVISVGAMGLPSEEGGEGNDFPSFTDAKALFTWANVSFAYKRVLEKTTVLGEIEVDLSDDSDYVTVVPESGLTAFLPVDVDPERDITLIPELELTRLTAPVYEGLIAGRVRVYYGEKELGSVRLITAGSLSMSNSMYYLATLRKMMQTPLFLSVLAGIVLFMVICVFVGARIRYLRFNRPGDLEFVEEDGGSEESYQPVKSGGRMSTVRVLAAQTVELGKKAIALRKADKKAEKEESLQGAEEQKPLSVGIKDEQTAPDQRKEGGYDLTLAENTDPTPAPAKEQRSAPAEGEAPRKKPAVKVTGAKRLPQGDERDEARRRAKEEAERKRRQGGYVPSGWGNRKDDEAK